MNWIAASLLSALLIGFYDLFSKHAVEKNAIVPVLFFSTGCGALVWLALMALHAAQPALLPPALTTDSLSPLQHAQILLKSAIVCAAWITTYFGIKHLPLSFSAPIRSTAPLWTWAGALVFLGERPNLTETAGILVTLLSFFGLSLAGRQEGVHFHRDKWVGFLIVGTLLNSISAVYDKYLFGTAGFRVPTVQAWFFIYLWLLFTPIVVGWKQRWWTRNEFHWRWSIPFIAFALLGADYVYFGALRNPAALVSVVISLRRGSALVSFAGGILLFGEINNPRKLLAALGILAGILVTILG
ncbi:MAG: DMT family transporter [Verrucomicrobiota bacterium]